MCITGDIRVVTVAIANSHHTGALAVYLPRLTERGLWVQLICSSPAAHGVAPFGGTEPLFSPNPIAAGIPTHGDPILLDVSSSIMTLNSARQLVARGKRFPGKWAMDADGQPSDDPNAVVSGGGSLLPVGAFDHGHKVRLPGDHAMTRQRQAAAEGVPLAGGLMESLRPAALAAGLVLPQPL